MKAGTHFKPHTDVYETEDGAAAWKRIKASPPDAIVISLSRLPSHGRRVAAVTRETKALRQVPIVFVDGSEEKIAVAEKEFPEATFTTGSKLSRILSGS